MKSATTDTRPTSRMGRLKALAVLSSHVAELNSAQLQNGNTEPFPCPRTNKVSQLNPN